MPSWVSEGSVRKYHRAVALLTKENADRVKAGQPVVKVTEEAIKELYLKWGGYVVGDNSTISDIATPATPEPIVHAPTDVTAPVRARAKK